MQDDNKTRLASALKAWRDSRSSPNEPALMCGSQSYTPNQIVEAVASGNPDPDHPVVSLLDFSVRKHGIEHVLKRFAPSAR